MRGCRACQVAQGEGRSALAPEAPGDLTALPLFPSKMPLKQSQRTYVCPLRRKICMVSKLRVSKPCSPVSLRAITNHAALDSLIQEQSGVFRPGARKFDRSRLSFYSFYESTN
jgi:hypothetical protein